MAPTLFARKTENCLTNGPSRFEVVLGKSSGIWMDRAPCGQSGSDLDDNCAAKPQLFSIARGAADPPEYVIVYVLLANQ
jgi:hypothetical protein